MPTERNNPVIRTLPLGGWAFIGMPFRLNAIKPRFCRK
jgi:hypothetical protein